MPDPSPDVAELELDRVTPDLLACLSNDQLDAWLKLVDRDEAGE